jgi:hypothetical protein
MGTLDDKSLQTASWKGKRGPYRQVRSGATGWDFQAVSLDVQLGVGTVEYRGDRGGDGRDADQ